jgi:ferric-dicitrate binding protein FerR (iron transport regulator)
MTSDPSRYVSTELSDARVNRLWQQVSERLPAGPARFGVGRWFVLGAAVLGVAGGAALLLRPNVVGSPASFSSGSRAEARLETAGDSLSMTLVEGSKLSLAAHSEAQLQSNRASAVALVLTRGKLSCDVTHREGREFTVLARDVEVRVVGTQFSVQAEGGDDPRIEVSVVRGVVEVQSKRRPGIVARVAAGQTWIQRSEASAAHAGSSSLVVAEGQARAADAAAPAASQASPSPASAAAPPPMPAGPTARELFEKASERRRAGDALSAARAYDELLRTHPSDARAGLSAFELGRLRMDRLGDSAGAAVALERALALNVGPSFREDALARLVSVYATQANFAACARARERYLASYPGGVHAIAVKTRCGSR